MTWRNMTRTSLQARRASAVANFSCDGKGSEKRQCQSLHLHNVSHYGKNQDHHHEKTIMVEKIFLEVEIDK